MRKSITTVSVLSLLLLIACDAAKKTDKTAFKERDAIMWSENSTSENSGLANGKTLEKLYKAYENGAISECKYNGQTVYSAALNVYDAGSRIYDKEGNAIGSCNYAWGNVDSICSQLMDCEVIYRVKDNIWGQPPVDKYGLGKKTDTL